ncbi:MAG: nucleoid-associated protein [Chryseolinea sp.]
MINFSQTRIDGLAVHGIGNRLNDGVLKLSAHPLELGSELLQSLLCRWFFAPFRDPSRYTFGEDDQGQSLLAMANYVFANHASLHENSALLAERLFNITEHPNIKPGELYMGCFSNVIYNDQICDVIGLFKSETKENFIKVESQRSDFKVSAHEGININKLDKGCLIIRVEGEEAPVCLLVDTANRSEARFWKEDFLRLVPMQDAFNQTKSFMNMTKSFVDEEMPQTFSTSKADKADMLNRSMDFFKTRETFNQEEFETTVLGDEEVIESFRNYGKDFMNEQAVVDNFEISAQAVKRQARVFKSVIKLDKNFHIYIHGNRDLIEKGFDEIVGKNYYKVFFDQET